MKSASLDMLQSQGLRMLRLSIHFFNDLIEVYKQSWRSFRRYSNFYTVVREAASSFSLFLPTCRQWMSFLLDSFGKSLKKLLEQAQPWAFPRPGEYPRWELQWPWGHNGLHGLAPRGCLQVFEKLKTLWNTMNIFSPMAWWCLMTIHLDHLG